MNFAVKNGATQIILGTIFETECKKGLKGKGLEFVREICKACPVPVYAIGGINLERLQQVMDAGAAGDFCQIAVIFVQQDVPGILSVFP